MRRKFDKNFSKIGIVAFVAFILISSVFGYLFSYSDNGLADNFIYKNVKFQQTEQGWFALLDKGQVLILSDPRTLEDISFADIPSGPGKVYIGFPPDLGGEDIRYFMQRMTYTLELRNIRPVQACSFDNPDCPDVPIINCQDDIPSIIFSQTNVSGIYEQESCVIVDGNFQFKNRFIDKLTLKFIGI